MQENSQSAALPELEDPAEAGLELAAVAGDETDLETEGDQHWSDCLPEELRELAGQAEDLAGLTRALERGLSNVPLSPDEALEFDIPELFREDAAPGELDWFRELAVQHGLSKAQTQAVVNGFYARVEQGLEAQKEATAKTLQAEYGAEYQARLARAGDLAKRIDELSGGGFGRLLQRGLGNDPDFVRAMVVIGEKVSESAWPGGKSGGGDAAISTEEFIAGIFNNK